MPLDLPRPIIYQITSGSTTIATSRDGADFNSILSQLQSAVSAQIPFFQLREKELSAHALYELTLAAVKITRGTNTRLLINDRSDIARASGADGVQLTGQSLTAGVIRQAFGDHFLIGVSTHSVAEAHAAKSAGANFVLLGPVFETESKLAYGQPLGLETLREAADLLAEFPVIAIGGINMDNVSQCFRAGASGIAAIRLFNDAENLPAVVGEINRRFKANSQNE